MHLSPIKRRALELGLTVHQPFSFNSPGALEVLRAAEVHALVVVAYGLILPREALGIPAWGCINIHASLLPRWRGAAPIQRAVLAGDPITGVTIMRMEAGLDTGPMLNSRTTAIKPTDTAKMLHDRLAAMGADLIAESLGGLSRGSIREITQPAEGVTYAQKIGKHEALIQWEHSAEEISRQVRAFNPWPVAETRFNGEQLRIWEAEPLEAPAMRSVATPGATAHGAAKPAGTVLSATGEGIDVVCGSGVLRIHRLQLAGRRSLQAADFVRGHRLDGVRLAAPLVSS